MQFWLLPEAEICANGGCLASQRPPSLLFAFGSQLRAEPMSRSPARGGGKAEGGLVVVTAAPLVLRLEKRWNEMRLFPLWRTIL